MGRDIGHQPANSPTAARSSGGVAGIPGARPAGAVEQHEWNRAWAHALLVGCGRGNHRVGVSAVEPCGKASRLEQGRDLVAQGGLPGEAQRGQQAQADRFAVAVAAIAGRGLERVGDGMAQIEDLPQSRVALVLGDDSQLDAHARGDDLRGVGIGAGSHALPEVAAGEQRRLDHFPIAGRELGSGQRGERLRVGDHRGRLVVGANVVLSLRQIDSRLTTVGRIDLRHQRGRYLHVGNATLIGRRAEPGQVSDHSSPTATTTSPRVMPAPARDRHTACACAIVFEPSPAGDRERAQDVESHNAEGPPGRR